MSSVGGDIRRTRVDNERRGWRSQVGINDLTRTTVWLIPDCLIPQSIAHPARTGATSMCLELKARHSIIPIKSSPARLIEEGNYTRTSVATTRVSQLRVSSICTTTTGVACTPRISYVRAFFVGLSSAFASELGPRFRHSGMP